MNDIYNNPFVEEIRAFRSEHAQRFGGDLSAICEDLRRIQQECQHQIVAFPPKKLQRRQQKISQKKNGERIAA